LSEVGGLLVHRNTSGYDPPAYSLGRICLIEVPAGAVAPSSGFELLAISYMGPRVDHWVERLRALLDSHPVHQDWNDQRWSPHLSAIEIWTNFIELFRTKNIDASKFREQITQQAYECVKSPDVHGLLKTACESKVGSKLWYTLKAIARPIMDCRMLWSIANQYAQFSDVRISPVVARLEKRISREYQIDISDAWARLDPASPPGFKLGIIDVADDKFKQDCAASYGLHAEIQLFMHYENRPELTPTLSYFGCSKKSCLLCNTFLQALPDPIATRGRHGICYPAWGVPRPRSDRAASALRGLKERLISRIKLVLYHSARGRNVYFGPTVPQSTFVSDFSEKTLQGWLQREEKVKSAKEAEMARREEHLIR